MRANDGFDNCKAQAGAIHPALTRRVDAVEAIEQFREVLFRNFQAGVFDRYGGFIRVAS